MTEQDSGKILIIWQCDKKGCEQLNRRWIPADKIINDDTCEICNRRIHEPVCDKIINARGEKEE